ncbi:MAG: hypothetical protein KBS35_03200 [Mycoplasma sp.]|nr:hypothetical protein [Candidatus Hennigella equi]
MRRRGTKLCILGITGSVGTQTVAIAKKLGYKIVGCSFHSNVTLGKQIAKDNDIKYCYCSNQISNGNCQSFDDLIKKAKPDLVVNCIIGFAGLKGTLAALHNNVDLALSNKESVVTAGWYIFAYAKKHHLRVLPIDSEHTNLYYQLLQARKKDVNHLYITCSGGKYLNKPKSVTSKVTYEQAISHKNWKMGPKITIDSNTLVNKCFEVVEAYWYFNTKRISVLHDPTSIIHSAIMLDNGQFLYSNSKPVMTGPIGWAISNFSYKLPSNLQAEPTTNVLTKMDSIKPISWAYEIMNDKTNSLGIIVNAADEVAIKLFKAKMLKFNQITDYIENAMKKIRRRPIKTIEQIFEFDKEVRLSSIKYWK